MSLSSTLWKSYNGWLFISRLKGNHRRTRGIEMSYDNDNPMPAFEKLLANEEMNKLIEFLIRDQAFTVEFLASTIANYFITQNKGG